MDNTIDVEFRFNFVVEFSVNENSIYIQQKIDGEKKDTIIKFNDHSGMEIDARIELHPFLNEYIRSLKACIYSPIGLNIES